MATISALISDSGATRESTKDAISLLASRVRVEMGARGEVSLSVRAMVAAPRSWANCMAFTVRREYRGKLTPTMTSLGPMRKSCSNTSLVEVACTTVTLSKIRLK